MRKKKGTMATANKSSSEPPGGSVKGGSGHPAAGVNKGSVPPSPKVTSTRCITPSPVLISKSQAAITLHNGQAKVDPMLPNGKVRSQEPHPEKKSKSPPPPPPLKTPPLSPSPGVTSYPSVSSPRTPRPEVAGPSGLGRFLLADTGTGRPVSAASSTMSVSAVMSPDPTGGKGKVTVGEIVSQIEAKSASLLKREDFTQSDVWADLSFLAQQSRYNSDMHVKRKLYMKMVDNGLLNIFLKVFRSIHGTDFLHLLQVAQEENGDILPGSPRDANTSADNISLCNDSGKDKDSISFMDDKDDDDRSIGVPEDARSRSGKATAAADRYRNMPDFMKNLRAAITLLWNVSEKSPALCEDCIKKGLIQLLLTDLTDPRLGVTDLKDPNKLHIVKGYLGILSNLVRFHSDARDIFRDSGAVKILQHYLRSSLLVIKSKTVMLLSYIINESENDIINSSDKHIAFFVKVLQTAMESENHYAKKYGYWAVEVVAGLNRLAAFESNKERIVQKGVLPVYTRLLSPVASDEEQILACQGLWVFAFSHANRAGIQGEPGCIKALENLENSGSREETRRTAKGALWVIQQRTSNYGKDPAAVRDVGRDLRESRDLARDPRESRDHGRDPRDPAGAKDRVGELAKDSKLDPPGSPLPGRSGGGGDSGPYQPHVMVSYQWSTRLVMSKVRDRLRAAGYKVWMDTDNIALPSLEAMSLAVERAAVMLVCLSQKYKDSPVCRTEAEYGLRLKKDVIPLRLQPRYHPDGWLGKLVGNKLAFDFTSEDNIDNMMPNLVRELNAKGRVRGTLSECSSMEAMRYLSPSMTSLNSTVPLEMCNHKGMRLVAAPSLSSINTAIHVDATMRISSWNVEDVAKWLQDSDLSQLTDKFSHVNGELLIEIRKMQQRAPETFYATVKGELRLDFLSTLKFTRALDKLT